MPDGLRAAASGLAAQQARMDALANDIANVSTPGYKRERISFRDLVGGAGAAATNAGRSFTAGPVAESANPLALAIDGPGFFQVRLADGRTALTRSGDFRLDANRDLVTPRGERLVPPLRLPNGVELENVRIAADGTVTAGGQAVGRIALADVPNRSGLLAAGEGLFVPTAASGAAANVQGSRLLQRHLEASNVDLGTAMVDLVQTQRAYQLASRAVQMQDQLREIANGLRR